MNSITFTLNRHLLLICLVCFSLSTYADPVLLFSDIESGPKSGWSVELGNKGAAVSIWGYGFGEEKGTSFVTVNGTNLSASADYAVWGEYWPSQYYQRITFWLNNTMSDGEGEISVTVEGVESNPLPFTIRSGNIYFITASNVGGDGSFDNPFDVHNSNYNWVDNMLPGDIYYFRDSNVYDDESNGGKSVLWIRNSEPSGTATLPIALLGFPGERPLFSVSTYDVNFNRALQLDNNYMIYSGFSIDSEWKGASMGGDFNRFIGNDVIGLKNKYGSGTGIVTSGNNVAHTGDGNKFLGNALHGGNSLSRYDHGIYISGCSDNEGTEVGWNHLYDNNFGRGPIILVNHQQGRCAEGQVLDAHFIFNNIIDCSVQRSRAIGISDMSYDDGEDAPEPTYVYNNVAIACGTFDGTDTNNIGYAPAMYHSAKGSAHFYNNTLYNSGYVGINISENAINSSLKNNIIYMSPDVPGPTGNHYIQLGNESEISLSNNLFYGLGDYSLCTNCVMDQDNINNQDPMFVDPSTNNFNLLAGSPAIEFGSANLQFEVEPPNYAPISRDINYVLRNSTPSIGAYEHATTACPPSIELTISDIIDANYQAGQWIKSFINGGALSGTTINYKAGDHILLDQGFSVEMGAVFTAEIQGCLSSDPGTFANIPTELQSLTLTSIFADNFDTQDDFANGVGSPNSNGTASESCRSGLEAACATMPTGWDVFTSGERFHPDIIPNPSAQPGLQINNFQPRGGTGKSMIVWDESYGTNSQWGSDAILGKKFSPGYDDIYAEMWIKFQPNYRWQYMETTKGINYAKVLRMSHSDSDPISTGGNGTNAPMTILDIKVWCDDFFDGPRTNRIALQGQVRCDPQETNYQCPGRDFGLTGNISVPGVPGINGDASFLDTFGNGEWHKIGMRMALNSAPGVEDGILMIWYDDELVSSSSIVTFLETGAPASHLITTVLLGGNMNNVVEPEANHFEQWYAIDDVRIFSIQ